MFELFGSFFIFFIILGFAFFVFWIWMLVDCISNEPSTGNDKIIWVLVILILQWFGALLYFFIRRPQRIGQFGR
jgi:Phospholipase_D-nuclease N-terminal